MQSRKIAKILKLLKNKGIDIEIEDKISTELVRFDGKSLSTKMKLLNDRIVKFNDHYYIHEIGHWLFASEEQRNLSDFGFVQPGQYLGSSLNHYISLEEHDPQYLPTDSEHIEAYTQEVLAQLFSIYVGKKYKLKAQFYTNQDQLFSWHNYETYLLGRYEYLKRYNISQHMIHDRFDKVLLTTGL